MPINRVLQLATSLCNLGGGSIVIEVAALLVSLGAGRSLACLDGFILPKLLAGHHSGFW